MRGVQGLAVPGETARSPSLPETPVPERGPRPDQSGPRCARASRDHTAHEASLHQQRIGAGRGPCRCPARPVAAATGAAALRRDHPLQRLRGAAASHGLHSGGLMLPHQHQACLEPWMTLSAAPLADARATLMAWRPIPCHQLQPWIPCRRSRCQQARLGFFKVEVRPRPGMDHTPVLGVACLSGLRELRRGW